MNIAWYYKGLFFAVVATLLLVAVTTDSPCPPTNFQIGDEPTNKVSNKRCPATYITPTYKTNFDNPENPLSEGGAWSHTGLNWKNVVSENGIAHGTQTGNDGYDDSYAVLSGFSPDQAASAVVYIDAEIDANCASQEVEILMRWSDSADSAQGYECMIHHDGGYAQIVRWNGPYGDFTVLGGNSAPGFKDGDTIMATAVGNVITLFHNEVQIVQVTDDTFKTGNPGIGFFKRSCGRNSDYGFTSFMAADNISP